MEPFLELRDSDDARQFLLQGLSRQRVAPHNAVALTTALGWYLELANFGSPLPPIGFVADTGFLALGRTSQVQRRDADPIFVAYEDYVLGRMYADASFERASTALCRYADDRERSKGIAFVCEQIRLRCGFGGVMFSPGVIKTLQLESVEQVLEQIEEAGTEEMPLLIDQYSRLTNAIRTIGDLLGPEDVFELEHRTAIADFSQRLALRQTLQAAEMMEAALPSQAPLPMVRAHQVVTRIRDEDTYPVGGFSSISNRGSIESLLHSQLAYMDSAGERAERNADPDLFDLKFLRNELLYYSRDDNRFLRRRRSFVFDFDETLSAARTKPAGLPFQLMILAMGLVVAVQRRLTDWLDDQDLNWQFCFPGGDASFSGEIELIEMLFSEERALEQAVVHSDPETDPHELCVRLSRVSKTQRIVFSMQDEAMTASEYHVTRLVFDGNEISLGLDSEPIETIEGETAIEGWRTACRALTAAVVE